MDYCLTINIYLFLNTTFSLLSYSSVHSVSFIAYSYLADIIIIIKNI